MIDDKIEDIKNEMDEFSQNDEYKIDAVEEFIDVEGGEVVDKDSLTPMDAIRAVAKKLGQTLKDPNPSCKHCYGRGWIGKEADTGMPYPCNCIKTKEDIKQELEAFQPNNRKYRRRMQKYSKKLVNYYRKKFSNKGQSELMSELSASNVVADNFMTEGDIVKTSAVDEVIEETVKEKSNTPRVKSEQSKINKQIRLRKERKLKAKIKQQKNSRKINRKKK